MISTLQSDEGKALFNQQVNIAASAKAIAKSDAAGKVLPLNDHELEEVRPASFLFNYCTNFLLHTYYYFIYIYKQVRSETLQKIIRHCGSEVLPQAQRSFLDQRALPGNPGVYFTKGSDAPSWNPQHQHNHGKHHRKGGGGGHRSGSQSPTRGVSQSPTRSSSSPTRGGRGGGGGSQSPTRTSSSPSHSPVRHGGSGSSPRKQGADAHENDSSIVRDYIAHEAEVWRPLDHDPATAVLLDPTNSELTALDLAAPQSRSKFVVRTFETKVSSFLFLSAVHN
jgi:hypothetical protein